jgi:hypothetical protein
MRRSRLVELQLIGLGAIVGIVLSQLAFFVRDRLPVGSSGFVMTLGTGLEVGVSEAAGGLWSGVYVLETAPDGTPFRWTNGDAMLVLPALDRPATAADVLIAAPNAGRLKISAKPPGSASSTLLAAPAPTGAVRFHVPLDHYEPGTVLTFQSTNRVTGTSDPRTLSVQLRSVRLLP